MSKGDTHLCLYPPLTKRILTNIGLLFQKLFSIFVPKNVDVMCLNPILRPNTNRKGPGYRTRIAAQMSAFGKDVDSTLIYVPCGHCADCVAAKQHSLIQRVQSESQYNHLFFATLTYDNDHLPRLTLEVPVTNDACALESVPEEHTGTLDFAGFDVPNGSSPVLSEDTLDRLRALDDQIDACLQDDDFTGHLDANDSNPLAHPDVVDGSTGEILCEEYKTLTLPYADIHHVQLLLKRLRDNNPLKGRTIRYLAVSELGKQNGRPHFHILFFVEKRDEDFYIDNGRKVVKPSFWYNAENRLYMAVFRYWAVNVGTRKNPIYEPLFTFRKRFRAGKLYTNFDLHYVDPEQTTDGTANVAYYVTKYLMKASEKERRRQQFLRLNLDDAQYTAAWNTIKSRLLISKGLGLDARFETIEKTFAVRNENCSCCDYANYIQHIEELDDLPDPDYSPVSYVMKRTRIMVPNFELTEKLHKDVTIDAGVSPGPIFIGPDGVHRPLGRYYQRFECIYSTLDFLTIYLNYDDRNDTPRYALPKAEKDKLARAHSRRLRIIDQNGTFDTGAALLMAGCEDSNELKVYD